MYELGLSILISYIIGSLNASLILGKINNYDVREHGSGNAGATNTFRMYGRIQGSIVFCFDCFKGFFAIRLSELLILTGLYNPIFHLDVYLYFSALSGIIFNWFVSLSILHSVGIELFLPYIIAGLPYDLLHVVGNITFVIWFSTPLSEIMLKHNNSSIKLEVIENEPIGI